MKEAYNPLFGFLYGWTLFSVIQAGTIAAVAMAFALFTGVFIPEINDHALMKMGPVVINTQELLAAAVIILLSLYNHRNVKASALMQNIFTITKVAALLLLVGLGLYFGFTSHANTENFKPFFPSVVTLATLGVFGAAMTGSLFSADAWNNITYTAGEVKNPQRNLPLSLFLGTSVVIIIYFLANVAYIQVLDVNQIAAADNKRTRLRDDASHAWRQRQVFYGCHDYGFHIGLPQRNNIHSSARVLCHGKRRALF